MAGRPPPISGEQRMLWCAAQCTAEFGSDLDDRVDASLVKDADLRGFQAQCFRVDGYYQVKLVAPSANRPEVAGCRIENAGLTRQALANPRIPAHEHERAGHDAAAEHAIELAAGHDQARDGVGADLGQRDGLAAVG